MATRKKSVPTVKQLVPVTADWVAVFWNPDTADLVVYPIPALALLNNGSVYPLIDVGMGAPCVPASIYDGDERRNGTPLEYRGMIPLPEDEDDDNWKVDFMLDGEEETDEEDEDEEPDEEDAEPDVDEDVGEVTVIRGGR